MSVALRMLCDILALPVIAAGLLGAKRGWPHALLLTGAGNGLVAVSWALERFWPGVALNGTLAVICAVTWWLSRRRKKRAPRAYGAKSRALVAAVVAKMRETVKPRPVFKPVPGRA